MAQTTEPTVEWNIPQTVQVGYRVEENDDVPFLNILGVVSNLPEGTEVEVKAAENYGYLSHSGGESFTVGADGTSKIPTDYEVFYRPGNVQLQVRAEMPDGSTVMLGEPYNVTVEEPVIETNAPSFAAVGDSIELMTALTNTALTDEPVAPYLNPDNYGGFFDEELLFGTYLPEGWAGNPDSHVMAYLPKVEIIDGEELVERSNADYTHILSSSETLTFTGTGRVTLKITYQQIGACDCMTGPQFDENYNVIGIHHDYRYSPTSTVTINVTEDGAPVEPTVEWYLPQTLKVGDWIQDVSTNPGNSRALRIIGKISNLEDGQSVYCWADDGYGFTTHAGHNREVENGTADIATNYERIYKPGVSLWVALYGTDGEFANKIGAPYEITVEEPIIKTNAPQSIEVGQTLDFTTELTNTSLTNEKVAPYLNPDNYSYFNEEILGGIDYNNGTASGYYPSHQIAYLPKVEVVEGQELVEQSNQDYTNILNSSETLAFTGTGTVKLKITYQQIMTCGDLGKWQYDENGQPIDLLEDYRYNPTTTVTINVTEPPVSITDKETGIQLDAESGIVPADTELQIEKATGDRYAIVSKALEDKAGKFEAFDISLLSGEKEIQPEGTVKITMPVPSGYDTDNLAVYHISDDGELTEIDFTLSSDQKSVSFETDHFSMYALAELKKQDTTDDNNISGTDDNTENTSSDNNQSNNNTTTSNQDKTNNPQTGDSNYLPILVLLMAASAFMCVVLIRKRQAN